MDKQRFIDILKQDHTSNYEIDWLWEGIKIVKKYLPNEGCICAAEHDQIWLVGIDELIEAGITEEDAITLRDCSFMEDEDCLSSFV